MLDNENKSLKFITNCIKDCPFVFIVRPCDPGNGNIRIVMISITEEQEKQLDSGKSLSLTRGGLSFSIDPDFCLAYGEFDLSPNSKDINEFARANWFAKFTVNQFMPSEYDYEHHCVISDIRRGRWYDTDNLKTYLPYLYACINKPKRICIFREYVDRIALLRAKQKADKQREWNKNNKERIKRKKMQRTIAKRNAKLSMLTFNYKN